MKACSHQPVARGPALAAPRSFCAPALLAAYALGATLWAPAIVLIAGQFEGAFVRFIPGFPFAGAARMLALVWVLRFAFYLVGAWRGADYGYGINGVIVSPHLTLAEKVAAHRARLVRPAADCRVDRICGGGADRAHRRAVAGLIHPPLIPAPTKSGELQRARGFFFGWVPAFAGTSGGSPLARQYFVRSCNSSRAILRSSSQ